LWRDAFISKSTLKLDVIAVGKKARERIRKSKKGKRSAMCRIRNIYTESKGRDVRRKSKREKT
jgi:hypothetical protein